MVPVDDPALKQISRRFESLGENCEFGFALRKCGNEDSQLLRWAVTPFPALIDLVRHPPERIYLRENLEPAAPDMVRDRGTGLGFHCAFRFREGAAGWESLPQDRDPDALYADDAGKFAHLYDKFRRRLRNGNRIFVYKFYKDQPLPPLTELRRLQQALAQASRRQPGLVVVARDPGLDRDLRVEPKSDGLILARMRDYVDNAEYRTASYGVWHDMMRQTAALLP